jgi:hypothetical protein
MVNDAIKCDGSSSPLAAVKVLWDAICVPIEKM